MANIYGRWAFSPSVHVLPLVLTLVGGGRTLDDLRVPRGDEGLSCLLRLNEMPSSDATGNWLRRMGAKESGGLVGLQRLNRCVFRRLLHNDERTGYMLDIDASLGGFGFFSHTLKYHTFVLCNRKKIWTGSNRTRRQIK